MDIFGTIKSLKYTHTFEPKKFDEYDLLNLKEAEINGFGIDDTDISEGVI